MMAKFRLGCAMAALLWCSVGTPAHAVTVEVARACNAQVAKAFPPRQVGNPAAGSSKGNAKAQREFFMQCVAKDGKMDGDPAPSDDKK